MLEEEGGLPLHQTLHKIYTLDFIPEWVDLAEACKRTSVEHWLQRLGL